MGENQFCSAVDELASFLAGLSARVCVCLSVHPSFRRLVGWSVGRLLGWLVGWLLGLYGCVSDRVSWCMKKEHFNIGIGSCAAVVLFVLFAFVGVAPRRAASRRVIQWYPRHSKICSEAATATAATTFDVSGST